MKKNVLITGASGGIGSATARMFALKGYRVIMQYNRNRASIGQLETLFEQGGCEFLSLQADLSNDEDIVRLAAEAGDIDILINNAGISFTKTLTDANAKEIRSLIDIDLTGSILLTRELLPSMIRKKEGKIINVSSIWGITGASCEAAYSAAKAGIIGFTKALAKELGPSGICVNCVAPGIIKTPMLDEYSSDELSSLAENTPLGRLGEPYDIASLILFLASKSADFITGQVISPNGGFVI